MTTTLVLGGAGSTATTYAAALLGAPSATVLTPGPAPAGLPGGWTDLPTTDFTHGFIRSRVPVFIPSLTNWLHALVDQADAWDSPEHALASVEQPIEELATLWADAPWDAIAVSNDPGMACGCADPAARARALIAGRVAGAVGSVSDRVHVLIGGRVLDLSECPRA